jgi:hypothetical protein
VVLGTAVLLAAVQATVDSGVKIPGVAVLFAALLGILWRERRPRDDVHDALTAWPLRLGAAAACLLLTFFSEREWADQRLQHALESDPAEAANAGDWRTASLAALDFVYRGQPKPDVAYRAVVTAPLARRPHETLAQSYRSLDMAAREFRRAIDCRPHWASPRLEYAATLHAMRRTDAAVHQVEVAFYRDPRADPSRSLLEYQNPSTGVRLFLDAARRGLERRTAEVPELRKLFPRLNRVGRHK